MLSFAPLGSNWAIHPQNPLVLNEKNRNRENSMKRMICLLSFVMLFAAASACVAADDANLGTWKLNEAKSKFSPELQKYFCSLRSGW